MKQKSIEQYVRSAKEGDDVSFKYLMENTRSYSLSLASRYLSDPADREDLLQDVYIKIWKNLSGFDPSRSFLAWMHAIIRNSAIDWYRKKKDTVRFDRDEIIAGTVESTDRMVNYKDLLTAVHHWLPSVPEIQQRIFILRDLDNLSTREVQEETGLSESSVKTNLYLVRKQLRQHLIKLGYGKE